MSQELIEGLYSRGVNESAKALGVAPATIRAWRHRGEIPERYHDTIAALWTGSETAPPPLDPVPAGHRVKGVSSLVQPDGSISAQWIKTSAEHDPAEALARAMESLEKRVVPRDGMVPCPVSPGVDDLMAWYVLGDPHFGMYSWAPETGADFDLNIAESLLVAAARDLVLRGPRARRAMLLNVGDLLHYDNSAYRTTAMSHPLDTDGRVAKVMSVAIRTITTMIDAMLEHHEHVEVDNQIGNHDAHSSLFFAAALAAYYRNEPRVKIPVNPASRHYHRFGQCLIGTTHGDKTRNEDLGSIMAAERPKDWGDSKHRAWYVGHVHHSTVKELRGVTVETFRTLAARDAWHSSAGYVSGRDMRRIVLHRDHGEVSREIVNVGALLGGRYE